MNRYNTSNVGKGYDGKRFFRTTSYPPIPNDPSDIYMIASSEDFLDELANRFYKDTTLWWVIAQANGIRGTLKPKSGQQLRLPGNINSIITRFNEANS
jgi:hypothetical protein